MHVPKRTSPPHGIGHPLDGRHVAHALNLARAFVDALGERRLALVRLHNALHRGARFARVVLKQFTDRPALARQLRGTVADHAIIRAERHAHGVQLVSEGKQEQVRLAPRIRRAARAPRIVLVNDASTPTRRERRDALGAPFFVGGQAAVGHVLARFVRRGRGWSGGFDLESVTKRSTLACLAARLKLCRVKFDKLKADVATVSDVLPPGLAAFLIVGAVLCHRLSPVAGAVVRRGRRLA
nr:hypothetical protein [Burkholderia pseudomallei]